MSEERRQTIGRQPFTILFEADPQKSESIRTYQDFLQFTSQNEKRSFLDQDSHFVSKQKYLHETDNAKVRSVVTLRHEQGIISYPIYDNNEVGIDPRFANILMSAGNDDDDHATTTSQKNLFQQICKVQLEEAIIMNRDNSQDIEQIEKQNTGNSSKQNDNLSQSSIQSSSKELDEHPDGESTEPIL